MGFFIKNLCKVLSFGRKRLASWAVVYFNPLPISYEPAREFVREVRHGLSWAQ